MRPSPLSADHIASRQHRDNIAAVLAHRLEVARRSCNSDLIRMLEQEQAQFEAEDRARLTRLIQTLVQAIHQVWHCLDQFFAHHRELDVRLVHDRQHQIWWQAYDPNTGRTICTDSEQEMRIWIEQNYQGQ